MQDIAIRCCRLSKRYQIGSRESYRTLRDVISETASIPFRRLNKLLSARNKGSHLTGPGLIIDQRGRTESSIWALEEVSLEIKRGDVVGIIGRNGAGKSTLLKILSRITKPTRGHADINGRIGSLLEVGTGFHPELTGRENIYLNGAILGMRKAEIDRKFDEIVAFAEVERFIDTPVKRYSSGMYVRLAFAVAAHVDTDILLVDEVLAVGDAQFQRKCFGKIRDIRKHGKTIVLVSHNMAAVRNICNWGFVLHDGHVSHQGEINSIVDSYLAKLDDCERNEAVETDSFFVEDVVVQPTSAPVVKTFASCEIRVRFRTKSDIRDPGLYVGFLTNQLQRISGLDFKDFASLPPMRSGERIEIGFTIDSLPLLAGTYHLELHLKDLSRHLVEYVPRHYRFEVVETPVYGGRRLDSWFGHVGLRAAPLIRQIDSSHLPEYLEESVCQG